MVATFTNEAEAYGQCSFTFTVNAARTGIAVAAHRTIRAAPPATAKTAWRDADRRAGGRVFETFADKTKADVFEHALRGAIANIHRGGDLRRRAPREGEIDHRARCLRHQSLAPIGPAKPIAERKSRLDAPGTRPIAPIGTAGRFLNVRT